MQLKYKHTQKAGVPFYAILAAGILSCVITFFEQSSPPIAVLVGILLVLIWAILLMSSLTVTIDKQFLHVRFGPGVYFVKFALSNIADIGPKYGTWWIWGWGIKWYFTGWLYNIAGFKSVEIILKNGKKRRIGTDQPEKLADAIKKAIS